MDVLLPMNQELTGKAWNLPCMVESDHAGSPQKLSLQLGKMMVKHEISQGLMFRPKNGCADAVDAEGWSQHWFPYWKWPLRWYWASPVQHFGTEWIQPYMKPSFPGEFLERSWIGTTWYDQDQESQPIVISGAIETAHDHMWSSNLEKRMDMQRLYMPIHTWWSITFVTHSILHINVVVLF